LKTGLRKVFFSDDGSTAMEVALKLAYAFARRSGRNAKPRFLSLRGAYHGDSVGAVALGHIDLFHKAYAGLLFKTDQVMAPYCYRCPFNRARPERADAREYRKCRWECLDKLERKFEVQRKRGKPYTAFVFEPLIQGAAGMIPQPSGWLRQAAEIARGHGALLIADEVMTGFGRTGSVDLSSDLPARPSSPAAAPSLFACHREGVQPDFLALAKGLTGGYLPMAATLATQAVFEAFLGDYDEFKTFFHGHSFTGNQLGAAAGLASLKLLQGAQSLGARRQLEQTLRQELPALWDLPNIGDIRQVGLVAGIELVKDRRTREPFDLRQRAGIRVCEAMAKRGVLTRPVGNVIVLMPPYCTTPAQARRMVAAVTEGAQELMRDAP
jgi:adenosylmethionine-8-amino-7-oxononanoate aminotransferase